jgi:hypothetical protein
MGCADQNSQTGCKCYTITKSAYTRTADRLAAGRRTIPRQLAAGVSTPLKGLRPRPAAKGGRRHASKGSVCREERISTFRTVRDPHGSRDGDEIPYELPQKFLKNLSEHAVISLRNISFGNNNHSQLKSLRKGFVAYFRLRGHPVCRADRIPKPKNPASPAPARPRPPSPRAGGRGGPVAQPAIRSSTRVSNVRCRAGARSSDPSG